MAKKRPRYKKQSKSPTAPKIKGVISITKGGRGFVSILSGGEKPTKTKDDDIEIQPEYLNTALNGDVVEVFLNPISPTAKKKQLSGKIIKVVERAKQQFVGILKQEKGLCFLVPDDERVYRDFLIPKTPHKDFKKNTKALISFISWDDPRQNPKGSIIKILGQAETHEVEMMSIVAEHGFDTSFPAIVETEAKNIKKSSSISQKEIAKRRDFRGTTTFTIDPHDAKDFDDALSVTVLENNDVEVGIHIADVSHYVHYGTHLDKEAQKRGVSIYLVDRTIPMLPEVLSNDICSLNPKEDKLTFSAVFVMSLDGEVKKQWFGKTIINSDRRFTYEEAQKNIDTKKGSFSTELILLDKIAKALQRKRFKEGSITFEQSEFTFELDSKGVPLSIRKKEQLSTHKLVEDFMLLANRKVAEYVFQLDKKSIGKKKASLFVYRVHDVPDPEKIEELGVFLRAVGYDFKTRGGRITQREINALFKRIEGKPEENLIKTATIRSMAKAVYAIKNIGHFGLAFKHYTHFTSPIRRYPDMLVHRILQSHLAGVTIEDRVLKQYEKLTIQSSQREIAAVKAERESIKYKQVEYMKGMVGKTFTGSITGITSWGMYVADKQTGAEGIIRLSSLKDDFYKFDKAHYSLVGERHKKKYRLGDTVKVKLMKTDLKAKTLEYILA